MIEYTQESRELSYRPDIDGLRAIAVLSVIFFHANLATSGGFVGVDIFFVISGYLISGIILKHIEKGTFSFRDFATRRICRLFPALQTVIATCLITGYFFQLPTSFNELANSTCYQQVFLANVFFWKNTGYFNGDAELKPLLHTWSLAIEEQFYLLFPAFLLLTRHFGRKHLGITLFVIATISLALSEYGCHHHRSAAYFFLPTRCWELMIGSLIWFLPENKVNHHRVKRFIVGLSLCTLLVVIFLYQKTTPFPGINALLPCLATAAIIYFGNHTQHTFRVLRSTPLVVIGMMSYSLYLWHWPVFAFSRELFGENLNTWHRIMLCSLVFPIAYFSWKHIELPFRNVADKQTHAIRLLISAPLIFSAACFISFSSGLPNRVPVDFLKYQTATRSMSFIHEVSLEQAIKGDFPKYGTTDSNRTCLLWGDSHAMSLMPGIVAAAKNSNVEVVQATHSSTPPLFEFIDYYESGLNEKSPLFANAVLNYCTEKNVDIVIIAAAWYSYARNPNFESRLQATIATLENANIKVVLIQDIPIQQHGPLEFATRTWWKLPIDFSIPKEKHFETNSKVYDAISKCSSSQTITKDPSIFFAAQDRFVGEANGTVYYRDNQHLSVEGGLLLEPIFKEVFQSMVW